MAIPDRRRAVLYVKGDMCACENPRRVSFLLRRRPAPSFVQKRCCAFAHLAPSLDACSCAKRTWGDAVFGGYSVWKRGVVQAEASTCCVSLSRQLWAMQRRKRLLLVQSKRALHVFVPLRACCRESSRRHCVRVRICRLLVRRHPAVDVFLNSLCRSGIALGHAYDWLTNM